ncbi:adenosylcobinamide amidohydrolase [Streptomyces sp. NPDC056501]|uniref:adenosylcobinamide amidohydrolase n=1 Tax=Streptomyces sp. NPDC056501 TaxID=3345841 RepID=UPI0036868086
MLPRTLLASPSLADAALLTHTEQGRSWPVLVWAPGPGVRMVSSAVLGGGIGERAWVLNAQVPPGYDRLDPVAHLRTLASGAGLEGPGVGLMTAASVENRRHAADGGAEAVVTAGIGVRGWAAVPGAGGVAAPRPGTINIIVSLPVPLTAAALVNAVATATEAKVQGLSGGSGSDRARGLARCIARRRSALIAVGAPPVPEGLRGTIRAFRQRGEVPCQAPRPRP